MTEKWMAGFFDSVFHLIICFSVLSLLHLLPLFQLFQQDCEPDFKKPELETIPEFPLVVSVGPCINGTMGKTHRMPPIFAFTSRLNVLPINL